jgi:hypothetical protein
MGLQIAIISKRIQFLMDEKIFSGTLDSAAQRNIASPAPFVS